MLGGSESESNLFISYEGGICLCMLRSIPMGFPDLASTSCVCLMKHSVLARYSSLNPFEFIDDGDDNKQKNQRPIRSSSVE
ncbi:uncharacterized protein SOCG_05412 [Schizosaccharomyces octosporus yFS286]|uniref:Uncharacterized protein n=1 Tax=Schizosaccharomyces octosporus (strain yFS286) TaxID=483514 RepID=S9PUY1_SCHOY|nr:uncharacterized protein SOCG_05412 [Schizosaccharomyces octosporus yFS286]EPX71802.1 hypothetical protein SOCG_05412 [Schizosaccharomyces octosporus yFS286]